jgi:hypothetical protein
MVPLIEYIRSGLFQQIYDIRFDILIQIWITYWTSV